MNNIDNLTPDVNPELRFTKYSQVKLIDRNSLVKLGDRNSSLKLQKPLNKDNPSDITLNINDYVDEQDGYKTFKSFSSSYTLQYRNSSGNAYSNEIRSRYPLNDSKCPLYLRFMNILKHNYKNV